MAGCPGKRKGLCNGRLQRSATMRVERSRTLVASARATGAMLQGYDINHLIRLTKPLLLHNCYRQGQKR